MGESAKRQITEIRERRLSLVRSIAESCFAPDSDARITVLRKTVRMLDQQESEWVALLRFHGARR